MSPGRLAYPSWPRSSFRSSRFSACSRSPPKASPSSRPFSTGSSPDSSRADLSFQLDPLSSVMTLVVTGVGFLIHVYSAGYMAQEDGYKRYFTYLNLFMFAMLILVAGLEPDPHVRRLGGRRPLLLSSDRVLVRPALGRERRQEGVHRQPHRRRRLHPGHVLYLHEHRQLRLPGHQRRRSPPATSRRPRRRSAPSCSSPARPGNPPSFRSMSGCPTPWKARRR